MPSHEPPQRLIRFIGKTGFVSRELWLEFFFGGGTSRWMRKAWDNLCTRGYCLPHPERRVQNVYVLNRFNRNVRDTVLGMAVSSPRGTQLAHDEILYRGILMADKAGGLGTWKTEGQLKASDPDKAIFQINSGDRKAKYPDALLYPSRTKNGKPVAVECELTQKSAKRYGQIMRSYSRISAVGSVLFITDSHAIREAVKGAIRTTRYPEDTKPVDFVSTEEWTKQTSEMLERLFRHRSAAEQPRAA